MGRRTGIGWTGATYNPWQGCRKKSRGCKFCYMFREKRRYGQDPQNVHRSSKATFEAPLKWQREVERGDRQGEGRLVFTCSWSDWCIREADAWRDDAWAIVRACPDLIFQILTKRSERLPSCLPADWGAGYPNVWLGVSVENQEYADKRIPDLLKVPARVRFLSCEPLLGLINLRPYLGLEETCEACGGYASEVYCEPCPYADDGDHRSPGKVDWVIAGGKSGNEPDVDPTHPAWGRSLRDQCQAAGVAFHWKQWGEWLPDGQSIPYLKDVIHARNAHQSRAMFPDGSHLPDLTGRGSNGDEAIIIRRVGKKAAGRLLDGREWNEYPTTEFANA